MKNEIDVKELSDYELISLIYKTSKEYFNRVELEYFNRVEFARKVKQEKKDLEKTLRLDKPCKKCGSYTFKQEKHGPHIGLYCAACNTWVKWIPSGNNHDTMIIDDVPWHE